MLSKMITLFHECERKVSCRLEEKDRDFSALGKNLYHCHLDYSWVAVWYWENDSIMVEVTYVGSREDAPY